MDDNIASIEIDKNAVIRVTGYCNCDEVARITIRLKDLPENVEIPEEALDDLLDETATRSMLKTKAIKDILDECFSINCQNSAGEAIDFSNLLTLLERNENLLLRIYNRG